MEHDVVIKDAVTKGLITQYKGSKIALDSIGRLRGVDRRLSAVIAIKYCGDVRKDCTLAQSSWHIVLDLFDVLAKSRKITCIRKFGDVWIGCLGFFNSWRNSGEDCYHAIDMACAAVQIGAEQNMRVCCAVDYGSVVGGFVNDHLSFDIVGQEVRWVLSMVELSKQNEIYVSVPAKTNAQLKQVRKSLYEIKFHK